MTDHPEAVGLPDRALELLGAAREHHSRRCAPPTAGGRRTAATSPPAHRSGTR
ncbi:hypothetical protein FHX81_0868 [Saccharothrix saharensis]|uniref:Uncharacterized protein n=1 Tax=Saccharothrix saharensis TaxID=571190 RepID=A0A543J701_9PSEU|nr:hypothetical protein [Saccharothrix saharensis]TQM78597.1 hypothetical protein FHX81_0868 [Saccharothrix saharensis]